MNDTSAFALQLAIVFLGLGASVWVGWLNRGPRTLRRIGFSAVLAMLVGFAFTYLAVWANQICRDSWHLCKEHGDGNMAYWFFPFFAIPINWVLILAFGAKDTYYELTPSPFDQVVNGALGQFRRGESVHQRCPGCKSIISIASVEPTAATARGRIRLHCACGKCDRLFEINSENIQ